jgi:hypothetical protein
VGGVVIAEAVSFELEGYFDSFVDVVDFGKDHALIAHGLPKLAADLSRFLYI